MSFWDKLQNGLEFVSPLNEKEQAPLTPEELAASSVSAPAPVASTTAAAPAPIYEGYDVASAIAPVFETRSADYVAPQIDKSKYANSAAQSANEGEITSALEKLKEEYKAAQEDARSRQMKAEMFAAVGNNLGNIIGGATAMNTKASIAPIQTSKINVPDLMGKADARYKTDYDGLLKRYKDLKDGQLSMKDMLEIDKVNAYLKAGERRLNENIVNSNKSNTARGVTLINKAEEQDELTTKQTDQIVGIDSTLDSLSKLEGMKEDFHTGPISGRIEKVKRYIGQSSGAKAALASQMQMIKSQYGKAISGATIAEQEMGRIDEQLPKETDTDEVFAAKLANFKDELTNSRARVLDTFKRSGRNTRNFDKRVTLDQVNKSSAPATVKIQGPSGQVATVSAEKAEKYLSQPGYKKVD